MESNTEKIRLLEQELSRLKSRLEKIDHLETEYYLSQQRFRTIFEQSAIGKKIINDQLEIIQVNEALLNILGYPKEQMLGKLITDFAHPDFIRPWKRLQHELWTTDLASFNFDTKLIKRDGTGVWLHITTILIEDSGGRFGYTILEDISERKDLERLRDQVREQEQRQQVAEIILNTQELERRRIAENLHNGLGQLLYGVNLSLNRLKVEGDNKQRLDYSRKLLQESLQECRRISHDLLPIMLQEQGLKEAVEEMCKQLTNEVSFECSLSRLTPRLDPFLEVAIYRMLQELLMNIVKHANASSAIVHIAVESTTVQVVVKDNGKGFDAEQLEVKGIGLETIRYKAGILSGAVKIASVIGEGSTIIITLPKKVN